MTDAKRLVETEKAVGGAKLVRWHEKLNEHGKAAAEIANQLKSKQERERISSIVTRRSKSMFNVSRSDKRSSNASKDSRS